MVDLENQTDLRSTDNVSLSGLVRSVLAGSSGITTLEIDGEKYYIAYAPMDKVGWGFLTVLGEDEVLEPTNKLLKEMGIHSQQTVDSMERTVQVSLVSLIVALIFFCIFGSVLAFVVSAHIAKPIKVLTERVEERADREKLRELLQKHVKYTGSTKATMILESFEEYLPKFKKTIPGDYKVMRQVTEKYLEKGLCFEEAQIKAFNEVMEKRG